MIIRVAGTSCGGSSYCDRVVKALNSSPSGVKVVIGKGSYQQDVENALISVVSRLEIFAGRKLPVNIVCE